MHRQRSWGLVVPTILMALLLAACAASPAPPAAAPETAGTANTAPPANAAPETAGTADTAPPAGAAATQVSAGTEAREGDPCAIFPEADLEAALGKPVTRKEASGQGCTYYTDDPLLFVSIEVDTEQAAASWAGVTAGNDMIGASTDELAGIGDKAFFGARDILYVLSGDVYMSIEAGFDDKVRERATTLARLALDRLR